MLVLLSPAKKLDFSPRNDGLAATRPALAKHTSELLETTRGLTAADLKRLMKLSDSLASLNYERFQRFSHTGKLGVSGKPAALAFAGDTYGGLRASSFDEADFEFAQQHVRILSGLYGLLRPLDLIEPYRLEMGTRLETQRGKDLYGFWGPHIASQINRELAKLKRDEEPALLVNLASNEYFSAVQLPKLKARVLTCAFKEKRNGQVKIISFSAKKARGMMARYIVKNRLTHADGLKDFREERYRFQPRLSTPEQWVFVR